MPPPLLVNDERIPPPVGLETRIPPPRRVNTRTGYLGICFRIPPPATCGGGILKQVPNHRCFSMPPPTKKSIEREYSQDKKLVSEIWKEQHPWLSAAIAVSQTCLQGKNSVSNKNWGFFVRLVRLVINYF